MATTDHPLPPPRAAGRPAPPRPTGRRRVTPTQIRNTADLSGRFETVSHWRVLAVFKQAFPLLGLDERLRTLIDVLFRYTQAQDWDGTGLPIVWPSRWQLMRDLGLGLRSVQVHIALALEAGLIVSHEQGGGQHWGFRDAEGHITKASGFSLAPLAERLPQWERLLEVQRQEAAEAARLRRECGFLRRQLLELTAVGAAQAVAGTLWEELEAQAEALIAQVQGVDDPRPLAPLAGRLRLLLDQATQALRQAFPADCEDDSPYGAAALHPITPTNQVSIANAIAPEACGHAQEVEAGGTGSPRRLVAVRADRPAGGESGSGHAPAMPALRGFPVTPEVLMHLVPALRQRSRRVPTSWRDTWVLASDAGAEIGISQHARLHALNLLGPQGGAVALGTVLAKHEAGLVRNPGGYLRRMLERHQEGDLHLDRTLHGLADAASPEARLTASKRTPPVMRV
ncbi:replication initiation protein RepC (plasmid) [Roseomonas mucosa]|nr:replication initiation protein RepC [Roseomonas mucosa]USQ74391.1 replication initiation protein RepC [Roseomonas mucosa]